MKKVMGMAVVAAALAACGGEKKPEMSNQILHANGPDWVNRGSGAFGGEKGKIFYGVGIASGIRNAALRRSTSDSRARSEIAKTLDTYVAVLNKDYQASTTAGDMSASTEEQHVQAALNVVGRAYVLSHGELAMSGTAAELLERHEVLEASYLGEASLGDATVTHTGNGR